MGDLHYQKDLPYGTFTIGRLFFCTPTTFERIGNYTQSRPTGTKPGRVYKKNLGWSQDTDDNWFVYLCEADPNEEGYVLHHPHRPIFTRL